MDELFTFILLGINQTDIIFGQPLLTQKQEDAFIFISYANKGE